VHRHQANRAAERRRRLGLVETPQAPGCERIGEATQVAPVAALELAREAHELARIGDAPLRSRQLAEVALVAARVENLRNQVAESQVARGGPQLREALREITQLGIGCERLPGRDLLLACTAGQLDQRSESAPPSGDAMAP